MKCGRMNQLLLALYPRDTELARDTVAAATRGSAVLGAWGVSGGGVIVAPKIADFDEMVVGG